MKKRIIAAALVFAIAFLSVIALTLPKTGYTYEINDPNDRIIRVLTRGDIVGMMECYVDVDKQIIVTGNDDPHIMFPNVNDSYGSVVVKVKNNDDGVTVGFNEEGANGFDGQSTLKALIVEDDCDYVFPSEVDKTVNIRLYSFENYYFDSIELHTAPAVAVDVKPYLPTSSLLLAIGFAVLATAAFVVLDIRFALIEKLLDLIKRKYKKALKLALGLACCTVVAAIFELIIYKVKSRYLSYATYNPYTLVFVAGTLFLIFLFYYFRKSFSQKPEKAFLLIMLTLCILYIFICPFGHASWDIDNHYRYVLNASYIGPTSYYYEADDAIIELSVNGEVSNNYYENVSHIINVNEKMYSVVYTHDGTTTVAHLLDGYLLAIGRLLGLSFYEMFTFSKLGNALIYCFVCYFAMKRLRSGKMILAAVSMIPTAVFLATNFSYDYWVNCFTMLGMAYFVGALQEKDRPISTKDTVIMCGAFALASLPKLVYALMLVIPFLMRKRKIKNWKKYYGICTLFIVALVAMLAIKTVSQVGIGGDIRGGADVSASGQIAYILAHPVAVALMLVRFVIKYLSPSNFISFTSFFAYLEFGDFMYLLIAMIFFVAITDKNEYDVGAYSWITKLGMVVMYFGMACAVAGALYIEFTPVGNDTVHGCQARYILPMVYPLLSVIGYSKFKNKVKPSVYNCFVLAVFAAINVYDVAVVMLSRVI